MIRMQVTLDESDYALARRHAKRIGISLAEFVRHAVRDALRINREKPWMRYVGFVVSGDPHSSQHIDDQVYGCMNSDSAADESR